MYIKSTDLVGKCITGLAKVNRKAFTISVSPQIISLSGIKLMILYKVNIS